MPARRATTAEATSPAGVVFLGTPLVLICAGFLLLMAVQAFVFGNATAPAAAQARHVAGTASAAQGVVQALSSSLAAPLATAGGGDSALPMVLVMLAGVSASLVCYFTLARRAASGPAIA